MNRYHTRLVLPIFVTLISLILGMTTSGIAPAASISWDDGGLLFGKDWSDIFNWAPNGSPAGDDLSIGNLAAAFGDSTTIDQDFAINSLTLSNGADADTAGNFLDVDGDIVISGAGSTFIVNEHSSGSDTVAVKAKDITIRSGGALVLEGGHVKVSDPGQSAATIGQIVVTSKLTCRAGSVAKIGEVVRGMFSALLSGLR